MNEETVRHSSDHIIYHFNANNAKKIALLIVISLILYHSMIHYSYGIDSCKWLLSDGRFQGYNVWQPFGCMLHNYSKMDARTCLRYIAYWGGKSHIVFIGDSRIRQLYSAFTQLIFNTEEEEVSKGAHFDMVKEGKELFLKVEFLWRPVINESMFEDYRNWLNADPLKQPQIIITGSGTWTIKSSNASLKALEDYKNNLTRLLPYMDRLDSQLLWVLQDPVNPNQLSSNRQMITNEQIDLYNKAAINTLKYSTSDRVHIWSSSRLVSQGYSDDQKDGLHMGQIALNYAVQILLNMYCNDQMNHNDGTCCSNTESITTIQIVTFAFFGVCTVLAIVSHLQRYLNSRHRPKWQILVNQDINYNETKGSVNKSYHELLTSLAKFGLIMSFFFLCDRTNFFMRENKYYTHVNFFLPLAYLFALGLFFTEESTHTSLLHRDQTDEWKGWMQLTILIYHMTGASQTLPIYLYIRVLVSAYLFLTGYGHFCYFWRTGDFGFYRVWKVLFRLNILVIIMCLAMNRPYQFYYFVPLITFWFLVLYFTMSTFPQATSICCEANSIHYLYVMLKFVAQLIVVTVLYMSEVLFEKIFLTRPWKALFVTTDDSIKEWWFRWKIDRYSVSAGIIFGFLYHLMKKFHLINDNNHNNLFFKGMSLTATFLSLTCILGYACFTFVCGNKEDCNEVHSYISFIPVISYIALRNISGLLRSRYSTFFAWFGKISLELFLCQYHIWLAANTHGVLVLIPFYPVFNVIVTSFIFVCISHEVHSLVQILMKYAIPTDWRYMIRNLLIFFLILVPIGIKDGMF